MRGGVTLSRQLIGGRANHAREIAPDQPSHVIFRSVRLLIRPCGGDVWPMCGTWFFACSLPSTSVTDHEIKAGLQGPPQDTLLIPGDYCEVVETLSNRAVITGGAGKNHVEVKVGLGEVNYKLQ